MSERIVYVALCVSVLGLLILTYASMLMEPPLCRIGDLNPTSVGRQVHVQGVVMNVHRFDGGSLSIAIGDGSGVIDVFVGYRDANSTAANAAKGDVLEVIGELDEYEGKLEVKPKGADSIRVYT